MGQEFNDTLIDNGITFESLVARLLADIEFSENQKDDTRRFD
jgi:hypothetical protein